MAGLSGGVNDEVEFLFVEQVGDGGAVADVEGLVAEAFAGFFQPLAIPGGVALGTEKIGAHVVVDAEDVEAKVVKEDDGFGSDEAAAAGDQYFHENASLGRGEGKIIGANALSSVSVEVTTVSLKYE
jgi:hypothetical protein